MKSSITGLLLLLLAACKNDPREVLELTSEQAVPVSSAKNVEMLYSDSARLKARIKAPLRESFTGQKEYLEFPTGISLEFFDGAGKVESKMTARYAISFPREDRMEARNNVVITNDEGEKLNTEHLIWDRRANRIYSNEFTKITSPTKIIYGEGFEADGDFSKYRILKIKGTVNLKE